MVACYGSPRKLIQYCIKTSRIWWVFVLFHPLKKLRYSLFSQSEYGKNQIYNK